MCTKAHPVISGISPTRSNIIVDSDNLRARFQDPNLTSGEQERLREILQGCTNELKYLDDLLIKYKSLGSPQDSSSSSRALDRVKWGKEDIAELRARLTSNTIPSTRLSQSMYSTTLHFSFMNLARVARLISYHLILSPIAPTETTIYWSGSCQYPLANDIQ